MKVKYTFEDWLNNKFYNEKDYSGSYVCNDSSKYRELVIMEKMTYETLNEIQDAQIFAYEYGIKNTLELNEIGFQRKAKTSIDLKESIRLEIESIEKIIEANKELYRFIIDGITFRGIKYGATFMLPEAYLSAKAENHLDFSIPDFSKYGVDNGEGLTNYPTPEQKKYRTMEVLILWLKELRHKFEIANGTLAVTSYKITNYLTFVDADILESLHKAEAKALGNKNSFSSEIRCAAFCEMLWLRKHIIHTKTRQKTLNEFSKIRYKMNIKNALAASKKESRDRHKTHTVKGEMPLNKCF